MKTPDEILVLLGVDAVLLPIRTGTKAPSRKAWTKIEYPESLKASYQRSLKTAPALGVSLGKPSMGLCSIDFDDDNALEEFLLLNPPLQASLRTTASRGANVWIVITDEIPASRKLSERGRAIGEWRATGNQTIISGQHPSGAEYRIIVHSPPVWISYGEIVWPDKWASPPLYSSPSSQTSLSSQCSPSLNPLHDIGTRIAAAAESLELLEANESLARLYRLFVGKHFTPRQGSRNSDLIALITFNFRAVGKTQLIGLAKAFYELNQDVFTDSLDQHMREACAHLTACDTEWRNTLTDSESKTISSFPARLVEAFRICRDLAAIDTVESIPGFFFLSCSDLADRLSLDVKQAHRILQNFRCCGIVEAIEEGTRRAKGIRGRATRYRWNLP